MNAFPKGAGLALGVVAGAAICAALATAAHAADYPTKPIRLIVPSAAGGAPDIFWRLNTEINRALVLPAVSEKFAANSSVINGGTPEHFTEYLRSEIVKLAAVTKAAGIKPQ
jgi:tripartite-type tricarboxylate transporter receptor subunit TctC